MASLREIMKDMRETLEFANNHDIQMIELELVAIAEAQRKLNDLMESSVNVDENEIIKEIGDSLQSMVQNKTIWSYVMEKNVFKIIPKNKDLLKTSKKECFNLIVPIDCSIA